MRTALLHVAALALSAIAPLSAQKAVDEPRAGLSFKPPKGWVELPGGGDRGATVRLYSAPRALSGKAVMHTPILRVMFFAKGGDASKDVVDDLPRQTPFRDFEDFVRRGYAVLTAIHSDAAKAGACDGQHVQVDEIPGERVLIGHTMALDQGQAAVVFEVVALQVDKLRKELDATFASLGAVPFAAAERTDPPWQRAEWANTDAAARAATRRKWAEDVVAKTTKDPEAGFKASKAKHWTVLSQADPAFTKKSIAVAESMRAWCEKHLPELTKEPPLPAVLRIFDTQDQFRAWQSTQNDAREYFPEVRELLFVNDRDLGGSTGFGMLVRAVLWQVFDDVDPLILPALPRWLDFGCWEFGRSTRCDGKKIEFMPSDIEKGRIDNQLRANTMPALWDLMQEHIQPSPADGAAEKMWEYTPECARLMRWLLVDDGQKAFDKPNLVSDYVKGLAAAHTMVGPNPTRDVAVGGLTDAQTKEKNIRYYKWRDAICVAANDLATPLQPDAWRAINAKWLAYNKDYK